MAKKKSIKVSYLIAVRNKVGSIGRCLHSLANQKVDEIVVVDGNSTDGTSQVIDKFPVIHLYDNGKGPAAARNAGLQMCTGDYVLIIDGDQWIPEVFNLRLKQILQTKKYDAIFLNEGWKGSSLYARAHQEAWIEVSILKHDRIYWPRIFRRSLLHEVGAWNENFSTFEDHDLWNRMKKLHPNVFSSDLTIYSDASNMSVLSEFRRGKWYGSSLVKFIRRYPLEWQKLLSIAPIGWPIDYLIASKIFLRTKTVKIALFALFLRMARSMGWLVGLFYRPR